MNATGLIRRIDDLGRIVIPKEIRRILRVREGDPMEIFISSNGEVLLKKYSPISLLGDFAKEYAESIHENTGHICIITDRDTIIASSINFSDYIGRTIGIVVENCMNSRKTITCNLSVVEIEVCEGITEMFSSYVITPIIVSGDLIGTVMLLNKDKTIQMGRVEIKLAETVAGILAKQMEN
jgi:AbrB family transcriptional regulator (stage V sporulation protein T)